MSTAIINPDGAVRQLDGKRSPDEVVTEKDVQEPAKLARLLGTSLQNVATLRSWVMRRLLSAGPRLRACAVRGRVLRQCR